MSVKEVYFTPVDGTTQTLTTSSSSQQSSAISANVIDITSVGSPSWISIGASPTAVKNTSYYLIADAPYRFPIFPGQKVACIADNLSATLIIAPVQAYVQI